MADELGRLTAGAGDEGFVASAGKGEEAGLLVEDSVDGRDEHILGDELEKVAIEGTEEGTGRELPGRENSEERACGCHDKAGGDAFAGDVGDDDTEVAFIELDEVIVIAAEAVGELVVDGNLDARILGDTLRE